MATGLLCSTAIPSFSGDRERLSIEDREDSLYKALQWVRDELNSLKSQDQSLMRQFLSLRSKINMLKDEMPSSIDRTSTISFASSKTDDEDIFYGGSNHGFRINSNTSFRSKSSSCSDED